MKRKFFKVNKNKLIHLIRIPPYNRIQLSSRSSALYERAILKTLKGRRITQCEINLSCSKTRLLYKNVSHPKPHISVRFNLFKHKVKEWLVYGLLTYAFIVPCLKSLATVDFDDFIDGVDCQSVRALMPELFVANDARQHATLSKWFDATCEAFAYLFTYCWKGHTPPLAYHSHSYLFDFGLTIDERRYYMGQLFGNDKADQFAQHDSWRQVQILMQSTIAFITNGGAKSYPKVKEEIEQRFNGEVKMTEVDVIKEKILFRNLIALVAIGGVWRQVRRLVHGRITRHPQNHCLDSLMVTKALVVVFI